MDLALLFWFYKEPDICENRLDLLKRHNGDLKIYGLFGGDDAKAYEARLGSRLNDFYAAPPASSEWRWLNGDLMLLDWYQSRGRDLAWDQVAVVQWDLLVLDSIRNQVPGITRDQICLSGLGTLDEASENSWFWTRPGGGQRHNYLQFKAHVRDTYRYDGDQFHCGFIFQVFPRMFFEKYALVTGREIGMIEYRVPTYAKIFDIPFYRKDFGINIALSADKREIPADFIRQELAKPDGWRLFHPYHGVWDPRVP